MCTDKACPLQVAEMSQQRVQMPRPAVRRLPDFEQLADRMPIRSVADYGVGFEGEAIARFIAFVVDYRNDNMAFFVPKDGLFPDENMGITRIV